MEESKEIIKSCWETKTLIDKTVDLFIQTEVQRTGNAQAYNINLFNPGYIFPSLSPYSSFITYKEACPNITLQ